MLFSTFNRLSGRAKTVTLSLVAAGSFFGGAGLFANAQNDLNETSINVPAMFLANADGIVVAGEPTKVVSEYTTGGQVKMGVGIALMGLFLLSGAAAVARPRASDQTDQRSAEPHVVQPLM